jgi:hypothetical protein
MTSSFLPMGSISAAVVTAAALVVHSQACSRHSPSGAAAVGAKGQAGTEEDRAVLAVSAEIRLQGLSKLPDERLAREFDGASFSESVTVDVREKHGAAVCGEARTRRRASSRFGSPGRAVR